jgi:hypothetical protein
VVVVAFVTGSVVAVFVTVAFVAAVFVADSPVVSPIDSKFIGSLVSVSFRGASYRMALLFNPEL